MLKLDVCRMPFPESALRQWVAGDYGILADVVPGLRQFLSGKARRRSRVSGTTRFFGEAYVAAQIPHTACWYASFKWLTSPIWCSNLQEGDDYRDGFRQSLASSFGSERLLELQQAARDLTANLGGAKPVAPDLWLTTTSGEQRFLEVKRLPGDTVKRTQLAGLALIAKHLRGASVGVVYLWPAGSRLTPPGGEAHEFGELYRQA